MPNMDLRNRNKDTEKAGPEELRPLKTSTVETGNDIESSSRFSLYDAQKGEDENSAWKALMLVVAVFFIFLLATSGHYYSTQTKSGGSLFGGNGGLSELNVATWNIAAINNNPFEYWITYDNVVYNKVMKEVAKFINSPYKKDVRVETVFTPAMFKELKDEMTAKGWEGVPETREAWIHDFKNRLIISQFMKDAELGSKRLASMPDRVTNTITKTASGNILYRPTVINCFTGHMKSMDDWWAQWKEFMFHTTVIDGKTPSDMLQQIKRSKYPAVSVEEERISLPLQTMAGAIFDAILVHMMMTIEPDSWQNLRTDMCNALNLKKNDKTLEILENEYSNMDIVFLQEVAASFVMKARASAVLSSNFYILSPDKQSRSNQNSVIMLNKAKFGLNEINDVTSELVFEQESMVADGDIIAITTKDYLLASFHGDTNGMATIPVVRAVQKLHQSYSNLKLVFGLDANTYEHAKKGKTQDVLEFAKEYVRLGLTSCWGDTPDPKNHTTYNARTFLQPQLNKAAKRSEFLTKGDVNPKDFILFDRGAYKVVRTTKDNTGKKKFIENHIFPTLDFPSDHGILSTHLNL
mmetsp:Transcript_7420/g.8938  ORF Transcript_7420/g.8938 Transcript_7420/m.8938 type:complete len:580 (-) Transcript_7420:190-1929(-)